jgi:hypothetical protein
MTTAMKQLTITAAVLVLAGGTASAQTLNAQIPFAFTAGGKVMRRGAYEVQVKNANSLVILSNFQAREGAMLLPSNRSDAGSEWRAKGDPVLVFECGIGPCALIRLWTGGGNPALSVPHGSLGREEHASLTLIPMTRAAD